MKKIYYMFLMVLIFSGSCTKNFEEFNTDIKNPAEVKGEYLFSQAEKELMDQISSTNVNWNIWKLIVQYWTETTYTDEANYDIVNRDIPEQIFQAYYRNVLKPLTEAKTLIEKAPLEGLESEVTRANKIHIIDILMVYCYHDLVNTFGDVPYSQAMDIENTTPAYDDDEAIYEDLIARLDNAISGLTVPTDDAPQSFESADFFFGGDVASWEAFANSLKLKIAINLADHDAAFAQDKVEEAFTAGLITTDVLFPYEGASPNANPLYEDLVATGRKDFVPANTLINLMAYLEDPRMEAFFTNQLSAGVDDTLLTSVPILFYYSDGSKALISPDSIYNPFEEDSVYGIIPTADVNYYLGGRYGYSSTYNNYSHINDNVQLPNFPGILMTYSEIQFYLAEAAARGWAVGKTAEQAYNDAITASFAEWNMDASAATAYIASPKVNYSTLSAEGKTWKEIIATQAYLSLYTRGMEAYNIYRRLDYPVMNVPRLPKTDDGSVPTRFTYPTNEQTLNVDNYNAAAAAIGGDQLTTKLFWDKY